MQLAVLTEESASLLVLEAIQRTSGLELTGVWTSQRALRAQLTTTPAARKIVDDWSELLVRKPDAVVVAGRSPELVSVARQFFHLNIPLLVLVESDAGPASLFEFMPLWQDKPALVIPLFSSGVEATSRLLLEHFNSAALGPLWRIDFVRETTSIDPAKQVFDRIDQLFLQDLHWITKLSGKPGNVSVQRSGDENFPAEFTVLLGGQHSGEVHWILQTQAKYDTWTLQLRGREGECSARCVGNAFPVLHLRGREQVLSIPQIQCHDIAVQLLEWKQRWLDSPSSAANGVTPWEQLIRLAEIGAASQTSLRRRRTIDIHFEEASERNQFKTQMTALGCGALLWTMLGMICMLGLGSFLDPRDWEYRQATAAKFVILEKDFFPLQATLNEGGMGRIGQIAREWSSASPVLVIESSEDNPGLGTGREAVVLEALKQAGVANPEGRVVVRPIPGRWFELIMTFGWGVVFAPLAIVLLLQGLIGVSRKSDPANSVE